MFGSRASGFLHKVEGQHKFQKSTIGAEMLLEPECFGGFGRHEQEGQKVVDALTLLKDWKPSSHAYGVIAPQRLVDIFRRGDSVKKFRKPSPRCH